ncbi:beta-galactosidase [Sphaerisporangium sp. TRM90804]|uniref:beta-galactosidase n=1 Tax=Sphaerisporangium sp. TRM90804 TaxID=3031113 RepID=UPI0024498498|nr:beta-galactosidase [Sphaerisporangium sp. TRM90804]MDH2428224.1 beta-galactosidase [Sphaerisporangium sp. TRM90804]
MNRRPRPPASRRAAAPIVAAVTALLASLVTLTPPAAPASAARAAPAPVAAPAAPTGPVVPGAETGPAPVPGDRATVTYDRYSLMVGGRRLTLQAAEFHYWRLPSPGLWRDVLERIKAAGFNAVSTYFNWAFHSPKPGVYDFTGVRDVDAFLRAAERAGLYVVGRPGPYINAETSGGGFPAWLKRVPGRARSSAPGYTEAYRDWLRRVNAIIAPHQVTRGGPVILYNAENEYAVATDARYMADIQARARADGIDVPITTNVCCDAADWVSTWASGEGAVQIPGVDDYPQSFDCANAGATWGPWGEGVTERLRDDAPVYAAEYQAGAIDLGDAGYDRCRELTGTDYMKFFFKSNLVVSGATMFGYYMGYGGTSWGWLPQPNDTYTSYDYGAAITEARRHTAKYDEFKLQSHFLTTVAPLTTTDAAAAPPSSNPALATLARADPRSGTQFVLVRHTDRASATDESATLDWQAPDGRYPLPVRVDGRDAKVLLGGYDMGGQRLAVSSSELMTHVTADGRDIALLYGRDGERGTTVLRYPSAPSVTVLDGSVASSYTAGDLRLDYTHTGLARVLVSGGGRRPLLLLLGTDASAASFWRVDTGRGPVLVRGTSLVRSAEARGDAVSLRADTAAPGEVEVFGSARRLSVNGRPVPAARTRSGSLPGPSPATPPALTGWRAATEAPEALPGFDDSGWTRADRTTTAIPYTPPADQSGAAPVLFAEEYGYDHGNVWYRGRFTATGTETAVSASAITGRRGVYLVWLNGRYLGSAAGGTQADSDTANPRPGPGDFAVPPGLLKAGEKAVLSVLVENMGHNDDWIADDNRFKQPRGLFGVSLTGTRAPIAWRIQGARGGEDLPDPARGPLNTGGLYGERAGWHLPGHPDRSWRPAPARPEFGPGVTWLRTTFELDLPEGQDTSMALRFGRPGAQPPRGYRVLMFLNGWNLGQFGGDVGPQTDFALPEGILRHRGENTLALAVISTTGAALAPVALVATSTHRGGVPVGPVRAPGHRGSPAP